MSLKMGLVAKASTTVHASAGKVWDALVNPEVIKQYMFGAEVESEWMEGSPIIWKGMWKGKEYKDKGVILKLEPKHVIRYSHFSPLSGLPDIPENYHTVTVRLTRKGNQTRISLSQDNNPTAEALEDSEKNWGMMLARMKELLEERKDKEKR